MIAFYIAGEYGRADEGVTEWGVTEWCYDQDASEFIVRWRRWACDEWQTLERMVLPPSSGTGLLNALAHADPDNALRVAAHIAANGARIPAHIAAEGARRNEAS